MPKKYSVMDAEKRHSSAEAGAKKRASSRRSGSATAAESRVSKPRSANVNRVTSGARGGNVPPKRSSGPSANAAESKVVKGRSADANRVTSGSRGTTTAKKKASKPLDTGAAGRGGVRMGVKKGDVRTERVRATEWAYKKAQRKANLRKKARVKTAAANRKQGQAESKAGKGLYR